MLQLLTCSKGHSWEAAAADDGAEIGRGVCPVCGDAVDLLPLLDLAPASNPITAAPEPVLPQAPPLRDAAGKPVVAGFEIHDDLGRTSLGVRLFKARQILVNRMVLLKVVTAREDAGQTGWGALRGEAAALGKLSHPNVVQILEAGERERQLFYNAVEWVDGPTLAEHAAGKPMAPLHAARLVEVLARAVHAAHEQGVVHRGLRPACIRLQSAAEGGQKQKPGPVEPPFWLAGAARFLPRIADFGLARRPVEGDAADLDLYDDAPAYLSPEQAWGRARDIGPCSDIYALGAILYELLAGRPPFRGRTPGETLDFIRSGDPPSVYRHVRRLPVDLAAVCRRAMQRNPRNRYRTALNFADDLRAVLSGVPVKARPAGALERAGKSARRRPLAVCLLLLILLAAAGMLTTYLVGAAEAARNKAEAGVNGSRATAAEGREAGLRTKLTESQKQELRLAYFQHIALADQEYRTGNANRARELLGQGSQEFRNWEWHFLNDRLNLAGAADYVSLTGPENTITSIAFSPDGRLLAAASGAEPANFGDPVPKREVRLWAPPAADAAQVLTRFRGPVRALAFSPDGKRLATAAAVADDFNGSFGEVTEWDPTQGKPLSTRRVTGGKPADLAYSPDGSRLLVVDDHGKVSAMPTAGGAGFPVAPTGGDWMARAFHLAVLNRDGTKVAVVAVGGSFVQIYTSDPRRGWTPSQAMQHSDEVTALAFNAETNLLASASKDGTAQIWNVPLNRPVCVLQAHNGPVTCVSFTPDGQRLATSGQDGDVRIWEPATGQEVLALTPFDKDAVGGNGVTALQFSPAKDDWRLAAVHGNEVRIFGPARP